MSMTIHVDIVSAEAEIFSGLAEMVFAPAEMGEVGIAPRHTPLISRLKAGTVRLIVEGKEDQFFYVSGGILEVQPHVVTILADSANRAKDLDEAAVEQAKQRAEAALSSQQGEVDLAHAQSELLESIAQLATIQKMRKNIS